MKKHFIGILTILVCLFLFGSVCAGPDDVHLIPLNKWNYKNVDGWGFYAKNGEYSWFGFILQNPTNSSYTVSLPADADIAHNTRHKIVNTSYKVMINGSANFLYEGYVKQYFTESFILPENSTYAVFMDIADIQPYSGQWDTDVFFPVQIKDKNKTSTINITGVLAYDARNTTPSKLTLVNEGTPLLTTVNFCRSYNNKTKRVAFTYTLKNNSGTTILLKLSPKLKIQGQKKAVKITYIKCKSGGKSCLSRISGRKIRLKAGETVSFTGRVQLSEKPAKTNFYVKTTPYYTYNGKVQTAYPIKTSKKTCSSTASVPATPVPTVVPTAAPDDDEPLTAVSFCRDYNDSSKKVSFVYELKNSTSATIPVELASSLAIEGFEKTAAIRYTNCISGGRSCITRIKSGSGSASYIDLKAGETASFYGECTLSGKPDKTDFFAKTSLRYDYNGRKLIPLFVGYATGSCSVAHAAIPENNKTVLPAEEKDPVIASLHLTNDKDTDLTVVPEMICLDNKKISGYQGKAVIYALDKEITGQSEIIFSKGEYFVLPPQSQAEIRLSVNIDTATFDLKNGSVTWNYATGNELHIAKPDVTTSSNLTSADPDTAENSSLNTAESDDIRGIRVDTSCMPDVLPATGFPTHKLTPLSIQPDTLQYRSLNGLHINIPAIDASAEIVSVPLTEKGEWAIEWLGNRAGIAEDTPLPGEGTSVIAAHNHLNTMDPGPFAGLSLLNERDRIFVSDGKGRVLTFSVYANKLFDPNDGEAICNAAVPGALVLLTCENELLEGGYANRRVVFAKPLQ